MFTSRHLLIFGIVATFVVSSCANPIAPKMKEESSPTNASTSANTASDFRVGVWVIPARGTVTSSGVTFTAVPAQTIEVYPDNSYLIKTNGVNFYKGINFVFSNNNNDYYATPQAVWTGTLWSNLATTFSAKGYCFFDGTNHLFLGAFCRTSGLNGLDGYFTSDSHDLSFYPSYWLGYFGSPISNSILGNSGTYLIAQCGSQTNTNYFQVDTTGNRLSFYPWPIEMQYYTKQ